MNGTGGDEVARVTQLLGRANAEGNPANAASLDQRLAAASATVTGLTEEISNSDEHRSVINTLQPRDVEVKRLARAQIDDKRLVYMLANALRASGYKNVEPLAHARTPVIKCVYSDVYGATDLAVVVTISVLCPLLLGRLSQYKEELCGPWDFILLLSDGVEASPRKRARGGRVVEFSDRTKQS